MLSNRPSHSRSIVSLLLLCAVFLHASASDSPPVVAVVQSSWSATHPLLEALELVAERGYSAFFGALSKVAVTPPPSSPEAVYDYIYKLLADNELNPPESPAYLPLAKVALSLHAPSAAVQSHYHLYNTTLSSRFAGNPEFRHHCPSWADVGGRQACSVEELDSILVDSDWKSSAPEVFPFDHQTGDSDSPAILYGDIFSVDFPALHSRMLSLASEGRLAYVLRFRPPQPQDDRSGGARISLSGYGVELAVKKTDYKVIDDRKIASGSDEDDGTEEAFAREESESDDVLGLLDTPQIVQIKDEEAIADLGLKASQLILKNPNPLAALEQLTGDFPKLAHIVAEIPTDETLRAHVTANKGRSGPRGRQQMGGGALNTLEVNGVELDPVLLDPYQLLRVLKTEASVIDSLGRYSLAANETISILNAPMPLYTSGKGGASDRIPWGDSFDTRPKTVAIWWNDLERDRRYMAWPKGINELRRFSFPGQLKYVRKNLFSCVMMLDVSKRTSLDLVEQVFNFVRGEVPIRFGLVPAVDADLSGEASDMAKMIKFLVDGYGLKDARDFIVSVLQAARDKGEQDSIVALAKPIFQTVVHESAPKHQVRGDVTAPLDELLASLDDSLTETKEYMNRLGVSAKESIAFCNGKPIVLDESWSQTMVSVYFQQIDYLVRSLYEDRVNDETDVFEFFATLPGVHSRRNPYLFTGSETVPVIDTNQVPRENVIYIAKDPKKTYPVSIWVISDFSDEAGVKLLREALAAINDDTSNARIGLVTSRHFASTRAKSIALQLRKAPVDRTIPTVALDDAMIAIENALTEENLERINREHSATTESDISEFLADNELPTLQVNLIVHNGRVIGPLGPGHYLTSSDINIAISMDFHDRISPVAERIEKILSIRDNVPQGHVVSEMIMQCTSTASLGSTLNELHSGLYKAPKSRTGFDPLQPTPLEPSEFQIGDMTKAHFFFSATLDPLTADSQKVSAILHRLSEIEGNLVHVRIRLEPTPKLTEVPLKRFYRYVFNPRVEVNPSGRVVASSAIFHGLPENALLTLGLDAPERWLVTPIASLHDLDNIKLSDLDLRSRKRGIESTFALKNILIEGHSRDATTNAPPRGAQLILGTEDRREIVDTMIMANLGYFQLKANPGIWELNLREGRSTDVYNIDLVTDEAKKMMLQKVDRVSGNANPRHSVILRSLEGVTLFVRLSKKAGMEKEDVLAPEKVDPAKLIPKSSGGVFGSIKALFQRPLDAVPSKKNTAINIFSVASGHLYERFMSIMFVGVMRHTSSPVKFWLIENFLSPSFKDTLPRLAERYGFDYELVTYKWPYWLRKQTEKQRTIWGYKILFLDVLFPMSLDRVIFVDADQIVRTDLRELIEMDIRGAAYAFTPMGDSRKETEGFRFWKTGYWANHLQGRPYHISALYLVDLERFRQMAAGDILRSQYQMLSADPESLANLDQDLPNNLQDQVPIFSLSRDWLWCETWCDDESFKTAKTIDLCNNPMTKEPKLDRAKRRIPEWAVYDAEVAELLANLTSGRKRDEL
ncbi:glycosyltransferase family 24 protein [Gonapodya prolifera JEL478]|uniref:Glycosyltransferase family 24 protein n=1 Tax=Gonapodya prolifera (strain JEL478) TaxID=1344416 RepID=A0A139ASN6_GONPJ|nr:glycosyltransferase family 24 protein [Gonapodya prolifera JEL478]|eukprot:KXS19757.1 glycosyltransferase family 24 protein [Gonapodya prolifera JEL478]